MKQMQPLLRVDASESIGSRRVMRCRSCPASNRSRTADALDMPEPMAWADSAISAAGSTCWELAFMGTPAPALVVVCSQERIASCVCERGAARVVEIMQEAA